MPIDIATFEEASEDDLVSEPGPFEEEVLNFLAFDAAKAFTRREIQSSVDGTIFEIASCLQALKADGYVRHKGAYWTISEAGIKASDRQRETVNASR